MKFLHSNIIYATISAATPKNIEFLIASLNTFPNTALGLLISTAWIKPGNLISPSSFLN
ncbi:hypothetical protein QFZ78_001114 [Paenibacillus sp. V4I5]|nr:hypothetical protein [Paenibacillus sp. V4I5]